MAKASSLITIKIFLMEGFIIKTNRAREFYGILKGKYMKVFG
jgi:hypothetical protein